MNEIDNENIEIQLLLEAIFLKYGYDFRDYSKASIKRRIQHRQAISGIKTVSEIQYKILNDTSFFETLLLDFSINVTEMFRDPSFFNALREVLIPYLKTFSHIKIWDAGCSTGEEVYSIAIILTEEGLYDKTKIYATDINRVVLDKAKEGIFPLEYLKKFTSNYIKSGGKEFFSDYYIADDKNVIIRNSLKKNIVFAEHNLSTDSVFNEMNLVICRNVLIYFNKKLQNRVFKLFSSSLCINGFLCLGPKETLQFSEAAKDFSEFIKEEKIYQKKV
ncbi:protein-glutamate O-methyltransferase CheR [Candidatus Poribacteria bacterium]|nr:protein-glutamate O-methyltransferase CheR [Candidatus Poribacteria bacterium]